MINAGAILVCTLLKTLVTPEMTLAEKFDFTMNYFKVSSLMFMFIHTCLLGQGLQTIGSQTAVRLSDLSAGRLYPQEDPWYSFLLEAESTPEPQCGLKS
jgi:hypothetical protein